MRTVILLALPLTLAAQYDKVAALASDSAITPNGGPASSPPVSISSYDLPDFRPTGRLNDQLPGWLQFGLDERFRIDPYTLNRLRFGMLFQPAPWFKVVAQTQDARSFSQHPPIGPPNTVHWDLKLAYAQFGDPEAQPVSLAVGRQILDFNNTILANSEWRNQARSYDAIVTRFHVDRFRAALFAASVVNPLPSGISHHQDGNNIYGAYGWIADVLPKSSIEPFVLWRIAQSVPVEVGKSKTGRLDEQAYGFRLRSSAIAHFDYHYELILERGLAGSNPIQAWATTAGLGYTFSSRSWRPRLFTAYDYASGDRNPTDGLHGTFDTMYPTAHDRLGIADQFGWQNIVAWRAGGTVIPHGRWSVTAQHLDLWLASARDAVYNSSGGAIVRDSNGKSGRHLGEELDIYTWYEINRQVHVGTGIGRILPGEFLARTGRSGYTYPYFVLEMFDGKRIR
jgi:hypothetical protein